MINNKSKTLAKKYHQKQEEKYLDFKKKRKEEEKLEGQALIRGDQKNKDYRQPGVVRVAYKSPHSDSRYSQSTVFEGSQVYDRVEIEEEDSKELTQEETIPSQVSGEKAQKEIDDVLIIPVKELNPNLTQYVKMSEKRRGYKFDKEKALKKVKGSFQMEKLSGFSFSKSPRDSSLTKA